MKKYLLFSTVGILFSFGSFSQNRDLPTLESLKKQVPDLKDTALINCLNLISYSFDIIGFGPTGADFIRRSDSIFRYANLAFEEAKKINYKKGIVDALNALAASQNIRAFGLGLSKQSDSASVSAQQKYLSQAISLAKEINYDDGLGIAYMSWTGDSKKDTTDYSKLSINYFRKAGNEQKEGEVCTWIGEAYFWKGHYEKAFEYSQRGLLLNHKSLNRARTKEEQGWTDYLYLQSLSDIATLYKEAGDYESSLECLNIGSQYAKTTNNEWNMAPEKAEIFRHLGQYDSSFYYLREQSDPKYKETKRDIGATYLLTKQYDSALFLFKQVLPEFRKTNHDVEIIQILSYMAGTYAGKKEYKTALSYAKEYTLLALKMEGRPDIMTGFELLARIYHDLRNNDSAYHYLDKYIALKDSIQTRQFLFRMNNYKKSAEDEKRQSQLMLLDKDNKLKSEELGQEALQKNFLLIFLSALTLAGIFVFRSISLKRKNERLKLETKLSLQQIENEKRQAEFQRQSAELEMQALRAQMNPHFIFNCLNAINRFIFINETRAASDYLTRFSRLIRMVLLHSQKKLVPLEDELEMLRLYLDMERMRFKNNFDYHIRTTNAVETHPVFIPPLLLQPFCENAIWHGLMHKDDQGHLNIEINEESGILYCTITDNGVGREKAEAFKSKSAEKEKSLGLKITKERLSLLNQGTAGGTFYEIKDLLDERNEVAGTMVQLKIRYKETAEEYA